MEGGGWGGLKSLFIGEKSGEDAEMENLMETGF